jgi:hypothetical protein
VVTESNEFEHVICIDTNYSARHLDYIDHRDQDNRRAIPEDDSKLGIGQSWINSIPEERKSDVANAIGSWSFSAHDFSDDELLYAALLMLQHTLQMPELDAWNASTGTRISSNLKRLRS